MENFGLLELGTPLERESSDTVTVIFIHGINGHRIGSWTSIDTPGKPANLTNKKESGSSWEGTEESNSDNREDSSETGKMWAADLLPLKIANARILTYGYDFGATNTGSQELMSKAWICQAARKLLLALSGGGMETLDSVGMDKTPLIFVCHDLGGVIVKEMLWLANNERVYLTIAVRTQLLVFLGTPHRESPSSPWENLVFDIAFASIELNRESRRHILTAITKTGAAGVRDTSERFNQLGGQYRTLNFYACKSSSTTGSVVVPEICATTKWPLEKHFPRECDHLSLCHFSDHKDRHLLTLCTHIAAVTRKNYQSSFAVRQTFSTRNRQRNWPTLPPTEAATIQWIITNQSTASWLLSKTFAILHIYGKAGSGKTVFAASMEKYLQSANSECGSPAVISFSFDRRNHRGRSFSHMLEFLIQKLLSQAPSVDAALSTIHKQITETPTGENTLWTQDALCLMFSAAVDNFERPILCIIDGVQDSDPTRDDMLRYIVQLGLARVGAPFKVVISSRESLRESLLNLGEVALDGSLFTVELDNEDIVHDERHRIIKTRLNEFLKSAATPIPAEEIEMDVANFCDLFLEVDLIIKKLQAQPPTPASIFALEVALGKAALSALFSLGRTAVNPLATICEYVLSSAAGTDKEWDFVAKVIPWLTFSEQPLTLNQLAVAYVLEEGMDPFSDGALEGRRLVDVPDILNRTLGPLIVIDGDKVELLHDSLVEILQNNPKFSSNVQKSAVKVHSRIASMCLVYLNSDELNEYASFVDGDHTLESARLALPESAPRAYDFLTYAVHHWPTHLRLGSSEAEDIDSLCNSYESFVASKRRLSWWRQLYHFLETDSLVSKEAAIYRSSTKIFTQEPVAVNLASFLGLEAVVQRFLTSMEGGHTPDAESLQTSLEVAAWNGHSKVVQTIVSFYTAAHREREWDPHNMAMRRASSVGNDEIVKTLLDGKSVPKSDLNACLQIACGTGHKGVVTLLVGAGADVNTVDNSNKTPLHHAAENGYYQVITQLLALGADPSAADDDGYTALHFASMNGHLAAVRVLLSHASDINNLRWSIKPLHLAARYGHVALVRELLEQGADLSVRNTEGSTPLHMAAEGGYSKTMKLLLGKGADACAANKAGQTPLHLATGSLKAVKLLIDYGADPDAATYETRQRPIHAAVEAGQLAVLRTLLECGVTIDPPLQKGKFTPLHLAARGKHLHCLETLLEAGANPHLKTGKWTDGINSVDQMHMTALHLARGHVAITKALLKYSTEEVHTLDARGHTPFFYAFQERILETSRLLLSLSPKSLEERTDNGWRCIHSAAHSGPVDFLELLLEYGADLDARGEDLWKMDTPLLVAARFGNITAVRWLLQHGVDVNCQDEDGRLPLHFAALGGSLEMVKVLVETMLLKDAEPKLNLAGGDGYTPLHYAATTDSLESVQYLLENGVDVQECNEQGMTLLRAASISGNLEQLRFAYDISLAADLHVDEVDKEGYTALHVAAANGFKEGVKFLVDKGANIEKGGPFGYTPLMFAARWGNLEIIRFLCEKGADIHAKGIDGRNLMHLAATIAKWNTAQDVIQALLDLGFTLDERDGAGRTVLFYNARAGEAVDVTKFLLEKGVDAEAVDEVGRKAIDVCPSPEIRTILGAPTEEEATSPTCPFLKEKQWKSVFAEDPFCDVCQGKPIENDFYYHCCDCNDDRFVVCLPCYDNGDRCKNPEKHNLLLRYVGRLMVSYEEYSPWVKWRTLPKDLIPA